MSTPNSILERQFLEGLMKSTNPSVDKSYVEEMLNNLNKAETIEEGMKTIGYSIDYMGDGEYTVYCHKEDEYGSDVCYEMTGTEQEAMKFLDSRGITDQWFMGLESYYDTFDDNHHL